MEYLAWFGIKSTKIVVMKTGVLALIVPKLREENPFVPAPRLRGAQKIWKDSRKQLLEKLIIQKNLPKSLDFRRLFK
jgi:hypothetical protein